MEMFKSPSFNSLLAYRPGCGCPMPTLGWHCCRVGLSPSLLYLKRNTAQIWCQKKWNSYTISRSLNVLSRFSPVSLQPHGLQPPRLLHSWDFPGKSTGVGCHRLLRINVSTGSQFRGALYTCLAIRLEIIYDTESLVIEKLWSRKTDQISSLCTQITHIKLIRNDKAKVML